MKIHSTAFTLVLVLAQHGVNGRKVAKPAQKSARRKLNVMIPGPKLNAVKFPFAHHLNGFRFLEEEQERCDAAFTKCLPDEGCRQCFDGMNSEEVDWANVDPNTPCDDIMALLKSNEYCRDADTVQESKEMFCSTFNTCVVWDENDDTMDMESEEMLDCSALEECEWENMHSSFLGDGICHDYDCYNTEKCGYDGGDCCEYTCVGSDDTCGSDGFFCRDPSQSDCDHSLSWECDSEEDDWEGSSVDEPEWRNCNPDEALIFVHKFDSWGDGWDDTTFLKLTLDGKEVYSETLKDGKEGKDSICLRGGCYQASANGGVWGNEVSWEVHTELAGPPVAFGGAPSKCEFSVMGNYCGNSCNSMEASEDIMKEDTEVTTYDQLQECIKDSCSIQYGLCVEDPDCSPCLNDDGNSYCRTVGSFNSLVDCSMCHCLENTPLFCQDRDGWRPGRGPHGGHHGDGHGGRGSNKGGGREYHNGRPGQEGVWTTKNSNAGACNPDQTMAGGKALIEYGECSRIDQVAALITEWDESNFGPLDDFEECAHIFANEKNHGGKQASDCMRMLASIPDMKFSDRNDISAIGEGVYKRGEDFCDCALASNNLAPSCDSFIHFKVLLHETLDACQALDEIDCAAWSQFVIPCKEAMTSKFGSTEIKDQEHCDFVEDGCGSSGAFPAFRRLDCGSEISKSSWDFYAGYEKICKVTSQSSSSSQVSNPEPSYSSSSNSSPSSSYSSSSSKYNSPSSSNVATSTYSNNGPSKSSVAATEPEIKSKQKYVPYSVSELGTAEGGKKKHHVWRNLFISTCVVGACFVMYKRQQANNSFDFQRYRRQRNYQNDQGGDLYNNLTGMNSGSSFEPPTLPPTPSEGFS